LRNWIYFDFRFFWLGRTHPWCIMRLVKLNYMYKNINWSNT
jgi:hypothetical protein